MRRVIVLVLTAACGGGSSPSAEPPIRPAAHAISAVAPREGADDLEVAKVNGRPVWGSCVIHQIAHGANTREVALDECIQFELLAQAAEQRGLAADPIVVEAMLQALVSREVAIGFEERIQKPADLGAPMTQWLTTNAWRMHRPDLRASTYARVDVPKGASPEVEANAKAAAAKLATELGDKIGLFPQDLKDAATRVGTATGTTFTSVDVKLTPRENLDEDYATALYTLPDVGRISSPVRTHWGWDVVLWSGGLPPKEFTRDEIAAEAFPELRRQAFQVWVNELVKRLDVKIVIDTALVARLEDNS